MAGTILAKEINRFEEYTTCALEQFSEAVNIYTSLYDYGVHNGMYQDELREIKKRIDKLEKICEYNEDLLKYIIAFKFEIIRILLSKSK